VCGVKLDIGADTDYLSSSLGDKKASDESSERRAHFWIISWKRQ
jgi:hypothetical protein